MPNKSSDPFKGFVIEGRAERRVYLEYGEENLDSSNYSINRKIYEQDAYDLWHLGVRYKELLNLRSISLADINLDQIPRQEKFLFLSILLLGSSRYEESFGFVVNSNKPSDFISNLPTETTLGRSLGINLNRLFCENCSLLDET